MPWWPVEKGVMPWAESSKVPFDFVYLFPLGKRGYARFPERWNRFDWKPFQIEIDEKPVTIEFGTLSVRK